MGTLTWLDYFDDHRCRGGPETPAEADVLVNLQDSAISSILLAVRVLGGCFSDLIQFAFEMSL